MRNASLFVALVLCFGIGVAVPATIKNKELGFTLKVPEGARNFPEGKQGPDTIYSIILKHPETDGDLLFFIIERLPGPMGQDRMTLKQLEELRAKDPSHPLVKAIPPDAQINLLDETWKGFELQVIQTKAIVDNVRVVTYDVSVPLKRKAIQISVGCGGNNAHEGRQLVRTLLAGLEGETNWSEIPPSQKRIDALVRAAAVVVIAIFVLFGAAKRAKAKKAREVGAARPSPPVPPSQPGSGSS